MEQNLAIGFFDSGIGGISVLADAIRLLPMESYIYLGDNKNAPLGTKTDEEVQHITKQAVLQLTQMGIKALVVACNTATAAAVAQLRTMHSFPIIGLEPALKLAQRDYQQGVILVMATPLTLQSAKYQSLHQRFGQQAIPLPCPGLMDFVEKEELESDALNEYLRKLFAPYADQKIDSVVLGCTHYLFLKKAIKRALPQGVRLVDSNQGVVMQLQRRLTEEGLLTISNKKGQVRFISTDGQEKEAQMARMLHWFQENNQPGCS